MILPAPSIGDRVCVRLSNDAVMEVISRVRAAHEEVDPALVESEDEGRPYDRRRARRIQLRMPVAVLPVDPVDGCDDLKEVSGPEQLAMTRDISNQGLGIVHDEPLFTEFAVLQFDIPGERPQGLLYEIRWTVRRSEFSYMSGGRLVGVVAGCAGDP